MSIQFACGCGAKLRASSEHVGKRARCPKCGAVVEVVAEASPPAPGVPEAAAPLPRSVVTATAVGQPPPAPLDPLDLQDFGFPAGPVASGPGWTGSTWSAGGGPALPPAQSAGTGRRVWIAVAIAVGCVIAFIGVGAMTFVIAMASRNGAVASQSVAGTGPAGSAAASPAAKEVVSHGPPVAEAEAEAVVQRFVAAIHAHDFNLCKHLFPTSKVYEAIADEAKFAGRERREFLTAAGRQPQFWEQVYEHTRGGGDYVVLRPLQRSGEVRVVVRLSSEQAGLNYHEYLLRRNERQEAEIADVYIMAAGSTLSESISQLVIAMLATRDSTLLGRFGGGNKLVAESGDRLKKIKSLMSTAPDLALQEFDKLPAQLQKEKHVMVMKLLVCGAAGSDKYAACFEEFQQQFPGDASIDLLAIDYYINRNDIPSAVASAQRLNAFVGGDPLLEQLISRLQTQ